MPLKILVKRIQNWKNLCDSDTAPSGEAIELLEKTNFKVILDIIDQLEFLESKLEAEGNLSSSDQVMLWITLLILSETGIKLFFIVFNYDLRSDKKESYSKYVEDLGSYDLYSYLKEIELIDEKTYDELVLVNKVRNYMFHNLIPISKEPDDIKNLIYDQNQLNNCRKLIKKLLADLLERTPFV